MRPETVKTHWFDFTARRKAVTNEAHDQISTGTGRDPIAKDTSGALEGVFGGETQPGAV